MDYIQWGELLTYVAIERHLARVSDDEKDARAFIVRADEIGSAETGSRGIERDSPRFTVSEMYRFNVSPGARLDNFIDSETSEKHISVGQLKIEARAARYIFPTDS